MTTNKQISNKLSQSCFLLAFLFGSFFMSASLVQAQNKSDSTEVDDTHNLPKSNKGEGLDEYVVAEQLRMT